MSLMSLLGFVDADRPLGCRYQRRSHRYRRCCRHSEIFVDFSFRNLVLKGIFIFRLTSWHFIDVQGLVALVYRLVRRYVCTNLQN